MRSLLSNGLVLSIGLLLSMGLASSVAAQPPASRTLAVWSAPGTDLQELERAARRVVRRALPSAPRLEGDCDPSVGGCIASMLRGSVATHMLAIRVFWGRGGCVPMRGPDGERTGHRMLRVRVVELHLYAADGTLIGSREVRVASDTDVAPIEAAVAEVLAL